MKGQSMLLYVETADPTEVTWNKADYVIYHFISASHSLPLISRCLPERFLCIPHYSSHQGRRQGVP